MKKRSEKEKDLAQLKTELGTVSTVILTTSGNHGRRRTKLRRSIQSVGPIIRL